MSAIALVCPKTSSSSTLKGLSVIAGVAVASLAVAVCYKQYRKREATRALASMGVQETSFRISTRTAGPFSPALARWSPLLRLPALLACSSPPRRFIQPEPASSPAFSFVSTTYPLCRRPVLALYLEIFIMHRSTRLKPLFHPGRLLVTSAALTALSMNGIPVVSLLLRHIAGAANPCTT
ncbi:hypothetical protein [Pararobbsia alpina]|uniref:Uncharacterized protein n=1 Tax=Pararobbsia alpina TaxID=621374 RepID=A0A6S7C8G8_9BURK|nr:hypothetical protein [Pararobbsia alpina]CAB3803507.1 hypothetical protein LMG28138_05359 [Pararobbsia alpina]